LSVGRNESKTNFPRMTCTSTFPVYLRYTVTTFVPGQLTREQSRHPGVWAQVADSIKATCSRINLFGNPPFQEKPGVSSHRPRNPPHSKNLVYPPIEWVSKEGKNRKREGRKGKGRDLCTQNNSPLILYNSIKSSLFLDRRH